MISTTAILIAGLIAAVLTAAVMTLLGLPATALPLVLALLWGGAISTLRKDALAWRQPPLQQIEIALLAFALIVGLMRLTPYAYQYAAGALVAPVTWDDNWHFQELASLVNAERFPPRLNFHPESYFHFYYVPWVPAAAVSSLLLTTTGTGMLKLGYALGALLLCLAIAWSLIVVVRHLCPPEARRFAYLALLLAGAAVDGLFALRNIAAAGLIQHAEWWQAGLLVLNSFSALSTALIWVPHHLTGAMAMLLAVLVATEPVTLAPRDGLRPYAIAGLLMATAAYSSIFAFVGGAIALSPLLLELARDRDRRKLAILGAAFLVPALPLAYIYVGADARGGFIVGHAFHTWTKETGSTMLGFVGITLAFIFMVLEVGWLYVIGRGLDTNDEDGARVRRISAMSAAVLASTAVVAFSGSNNWALRATIVPVVLLAAYVGRGLAASEPRDGTRLDPGVIRKAGAVALALAAIAHLNETAVLATRAVRAPAYAAENDSCKAAILALNASQSQRTTLPDRRDCRDAHSAYHIERRFQKDPLTDVDRELMGRGLSFAPRPGTSLSAR